MRSFIVIIGIYSLICSAVLNLNCATKETISFTFDLNQSLDASIRVKKFWESTGFCPPDPKNKIQDFILGNDEKLNLLLIGALPKRTIKQVRIHWLLNLIQIRFDGNGTLLYNFTALDTVLDWIRAQKLYPGFELMGIPKYIETSGRSFHYKEVIPKLEIKTYNFWNQIVLKIVRRYSKRYGFGYIKKWRFETWNEPDLHTYNVLNFTLNEYLSYVQASSDALQGFAKTQNSTLKLGGPAGLFKDPIKHPLCWGLLRKCDAEKKWRICPIQFISFHRKGDGVADKILNESLALLDLMHSQFPGIRHIPIANDEADILTNWSLSEEWRGDVRYAAMIVKVIINHYKVLVVNMNLTLELLSNDNAFLNYHPYYFTQRTLLARFQMNNTNPRHVQFIKKPAYSVMGLLGFVEDEYLKDDFIEADSLVSLLATRSAKNTHKSHSTSLLITYVNNTEPQGKATRINAIFNSLPGLDSKYVIYVLDNLVTNPYFVWKNEGSPVFPNETVRQKMRTVEEPFRLRGPIPVINSTLKVQLHLRLPSVAVIYICSKILDPPGRVTDLNGFNITRNEILLVWKDDKIGTKCIRTYEVEFQSEDRHIGSGAFRRINLVDTIFLSYHHAVKGNSTHDATRGKYRVRAVNYWNVPGKFSKNYTYP